MKDLEQVLVFAWLLSKAEQEAIMGLTKEIYAKAGGPAASGVRKSGAGKSQSASSASASGDAKSSAQAALCISEAAQMFK